MKELKPNKVNMMKDLLPKLMIVATILIGVGIFWLVSTRPGAGVGANAALTLEEPPSTCGYCERNLVGATSEEIGEFVVDLAMTQLNPQGSPEVLAVRSIVWEESAQLGLGCLPDFASIEDAPLAVVILKGEHGPGKCSAWPRISPSRAKACQICGHCNGFMGCELGPLNWLSNW